MAGDGGDETYGILAPHVERDVLVADGRHLVRGGQQFVVDARRLGVQGARLHDDAYLGRRFLPVQLRADEDVADAHHRLAHDVRAPQHGGCVVLPALERRDGRRVVQCDLQRVEPLADAAREVELGRQRRIGVVCHGLAVEPHLVVLGGGGDSSTERFAQSNGTVNEVVNRLSCRSQRVSGLR